MLRRGNAESQDGSDPVALIPFSRMNRPLSRSASHLFIMKTTPVRFVSLAALAGLSALVFTGCNKQDRSTVSAKTSEAVADTKNAMGNAWDSVKSHTWEKRDDFSANAKAVGSRFDAQMSELHANYSEAKASASRKAAM